MKITRKNLNKCILIAGATLTTLTRSACGFEDALYTMFEQTGIPRNIKFETKWEKVDVKTIIEQGLECSDNIRKNIRRNSARRSGTFDLEGILSRAESIRQKTQDN